MPRRRRSCAVRSRRSCQANGSRMRLRPRAQEQLGIGTIVTHLGENDSLSDDARAVSAHYLGVIDAVRATGPQRADCRHTDAPRARHRPRARPRPAAPAGGARRRHRQPRLARHGELALRRPDARSVPSAASALGACGYRRARPPHRRRLRSGLVSLVHAAPRRAPRRISRSFSGISWSVRAKQAHAVCTCPPAYHRRRRRAPRPAGTTPPRETSRFAARRTPTVTSVDVRPRPPPGGASSPIGASAS